MEISEPDGVLAFAREKDGNKVIVVVNFNEEDAPVTLYLDGKYTELFTGGEAEGEVSQIVRPGGYIVLTQ